jgi:hypothetical protein
MIPTFTLTGTEVTLLGAVHTGHISVAANSVVRDAEGQVVMSGPVTVPLDATGHFAVDLPAADPAVNPPTGLGYIVRYPTRPPQFIAAQPAGTTLDVVDVVGSEPTVPITVIVGPQGPPGEPGTGGGGGGRVGDYRRTRLGSGPKGSAPAGIWVRPPNTIRSATMALAPDYTFAVGHMLTADPTETQTVIGVKTYIEAAGGVGTSVYAAFYDSDPETWMPTVRLGRSWAIDPIPGAVSFGLFSTAVPVGRPLFVAFAAVGPSPSPQVTMTQQVDPSEGNFGINSLDAGEPSYTPDFAPLCHSLLWSFTEALPPDLTAQKDMWWPSASVPFHTIGVRRITPAEGEASS